MKRFLDEIFKLFIGSSSSLQMLFDQMNKIHQSIKFTMTHTTNVYEDISTKCACPEQPSIPFLDTSLETKKMDKSF